MTMTRAELQDAARQAFGGDGPAPDAARSWSLIAEMGWLMMAVPEDRGGLGLGREAIALIHNELGRALVPGPAIAQMLAIEALVGADATPDTDDLLARAIGGEVMTAALADGAPGMAVPDADRATHLLTLAPDRVALVPLAGATIVARKTWDRTRRLFDVTPAGDGATLATDAAAAALGERVAGLRSLALAGDSLGGAAAILALTIDYLGTRHQFGRPLAMFQALKHRVADLMTRLAIAEALFWSRAVDPDATAPALAALKAHATDAYAAIAEEAVQLHGGIGLTMEHHCHLFLKRALLNRALGGDNDRIDEGAGRAILAESAA